MNSTALATNLLGRSVRLHRPPEGTRTDTGRIAAIYLDGQGLHYVVLLSGRLVDVDSGAQLTVLDDGDAL